MKKRNVALGFYQEFSTAEAVVEELQQKNFYRFATIQQQKNNRIKIKRYFSKTALFFIYSSMAAIFCLILLNYLEITHISLETLKLTVTSLIALATGFVFWGYSKLIHMEILNRYKPFVLANEILIIAEVNQEDIRDVLTTLRQVKSGHPVTFLVRPAMHETDPIEIPKEPLNIEALREEAARVSVGHSSETIGFIDKYDNKLMLNFESTIKMLHFLQHDISDAEYVEQKIPSSAEWLLDNMYVIEGSIEDVRLNLPKKYYKTLPKILNGPLKGLPRIYALAIELVKDTTGNLTRENIITFLDSYQIDNPLTIGELWAFPLMLRLRLIEWLEYLAINVDNHMREGELAAFYGNRLLNAVHHDKKQLPALLTDLSKEQSRFSGHFATELLDHLFDEETILPIVRQWLEKRFEKPLEEILHQEHLDETYEQIVFSNSIKSLMTLSQLSWSDIFEEVSPVDAILRQDFAEVYSRMDFTTRNRYREIIENMARRTKLKEVDIAENALLLAHAGTNAYNQHVGYYLLDNGRKKLEEKIHYKKTLRESIHAWVIKHSTFVYLGGIIGCTLILEGILFYYLSNTNLNVIGKSCLLLLSLLPISELSVQFVNLILNLFLLTPLLPKMSFETGVPLEYKTLVVVPMMLLTPESIRSEIDRLEIRYLANTDNFLKFALFSDFTDAKTPHAETDNALLKIAIDGLNTLEEKYGHGKFFLFHRQRTWSNSENRWIGEERKRGKLEYLNRFLMGETLPENIVYMGKPQELKGISFVITLDADTQLPKDQARALVEVISHPLNRAVLNPDQTRLERGYTIIQPRVGTDFIDAKATLFSKIFSDPTVVDPYTQAISNIYQDLVQESSYHGKGIYDVQTFHRILSNHFPKEHLLSHDLIEGAFVRVGFTAQSCLFDTHPKNYLTWIKRQHRWMRGDWQIIDWIFNKVPKHSKGLVTGFEVNILSPLNRWKIFDNLRRALLPVALLSTLIAGWLWSPIPFVLTTLVLLVLLLPSIILCISKLFTSFFPIKSFFEELKLTTLRSLITIALLPIDAYFSLDALVRVGFRRFFSHKNLLQWSIGETDMTAHNIFIYQLGWVSVFAILILSIVSYFSPLAALIAWPFCLLWLCSPLILYYIDKPIGKLKDEQIPAVDEQFLRKVAARTWRYFDELVGPKTHWMPPDNYQTALNIEIAQRTSPTNTGLWLFALLNAYDFNYITSDILIDKTLFTITELKKLERYEGHFLNWYNIATLEPLFPRYVSTVDSGNFLACLWTVNQALEEIISTPIIPKDPLSGVRDTYAVFADMQTATNLELQRLLELEVSDNLLDFMERVKETLKIVQGLPVTKASSYWQQKMEGQLMEWEAALSRYFEWAEILKEIPIETLHAIDPQSTTWKEQSLAWRPSLEMLANKKILPALNHFIKATTRADLPIEIKALGKKLQAALERAEWLAGEKLGLCKEIIKDINHFSEEMNLKFLYNPERKLFAIGYNVDAQKIDSSHYDLLASEARITSLVAIAKEDVPLDHWWALGRLYGMARGKRVLLSWGGTMFEYLMPLIIAKQYSDSLLGNACEAAVDCQIDYGKMRGIPWGISESAFSALDSYKIYQYKSFGVPGLGLKRGLEEDLVISPYSTVLAIAVRPKAAIENLKKMTKEKDLMGTYGFYESMDFTRQKGPTGERGVIVYTYMAHHQGMIFATINNFLNKDVIINRFQKDPRISGVSSLLYERIPQSPAIKTSPGRREPVLRRLEPFSNVPIMGVVPKAISVTPKINLLSNGQYSLMITNTGGGYSRCKDIEIYRWRSDTTQDAWGSFCYIQDMKSKDVWSQTFQPTCNSEDYSVNFKSDKAEFRRKDNKIETFTEVVVSPEDNAEIRLMTLINYSNEIRILELTSYLELVLAQHVTDRAHPAFNKLFIETEKVPEKPALLGFRRLRSPDDLPIFAAHILSSDQISDEAVQYETDRNRFIGRGNTLKHPKALDEALSNTTGTVLDPIFSLRQKVILKPGRRVQVSFITTLTNSRESALELIEKYKDIKASHRALELAWNYSQLELRYLRIHQEEGQLFQKLASRLIYPHIQFRASESRLNKNILGQSGLWTMGISGDLPIVLVTVGDVYDVELVKQLLIAHAFWSLRGLKVDLVILNEQATGYNQSLQEQLQAQIQAHSFRNETEKPGGVFLRNSDQMSPEILDLLFAVAHVVLIASRGGLRQQLVSPKPKHRHSKLIINEAMKEAPSKPLPFLELPYFNGLGGYTEDGKSYVIYLGPHTNTPAPWINVLANPQFGMIVTEAGLGCSWYGNSQTNRLTPWSNDPLLNPISDTIYIRDEEMGTVWTPTPAPIRELDAYRISHSQGYTRFEHNSHGIGQELLVFVPVDDKDGLPLRIQRLRLTNHSQKRRSLSLTAYTEWVLGDDKEKTEMQIITEWDLKNKALFATNRYNPDFGDYVAFSFSTKFINSYTGDRAEFIGRNKTSANPEGLTRKSLSGHTGVALDPCAALQVLVNIEPGAEVEVDFILGYAKGKEAAHLLIEKCQSKEKIDQLFEETKNWWDKTLETIQVDVPDMATNFLVNRWLIYQDLSCRFWGRAAFYQSSGAFGFRDQLQDTMALVYSLPNVAREYILKAASRQFLEGDVQHWWHAQSGAGVRTRCSDDFLWLPFVTAQYIRITGDASILNEQVSFLEGDILQPDQHEVFSIPKISTEKASLMEHCQRAVNRGMTAGPHGLPLIGTCDWNDGMSLVGIGGKGESIWLAWFTIHVLHDFAELLTISGEKPEVTTKYIEEAKRLAQVVEAEGWDGAWYLRAYFDDGMPLGSHTSQEAFIDSLPQSWAVIAGLADPERVKSALKSAEEFLVNDQKNIVLLLTPPFDKTPLNPGYIKGYPPGVRENGGQYTHAATWFAMALARSGQGDKAVKLLKMISPTLHTPTPADNELYKVEPYVIVADIYDLKGQVGRGGWSWYTGAAAWVYRVWLEEILGFKLRGQNLSFNCSIPKEWDQFKVNYRYKTAHYDITVTNPNHLTGGTGQVTLDGVKLNSNVIPLVDDGKTHVVKILLGG